MTFVNTSRWTYLKHCFYSRSFLYGIGITAGRRQLRSTSLWSDIIQFLHSDRTLNHTGSFQDLQSARSNTSTKEFSTNDKDASSFTLKLPLTRPIHYTEARGRTTSIYPTSEFISMVQGRNKRAIGSLFGITTFGMNITTLEPLKDITLNTTAKDDHETSKSASSSSIVHYHTKQDEMIYIISGTATLLLYDVDTTTYEDILMTAGDVMGFPAGRTVGHSIRNMSTTEPLTILEMGDRTKYDTAIHPEPSIDLCAKQLNENGDQNANDDDESNSTNSVAQYYFFHKDGRPY